MDANAGPLSGIRPQAGPSTPAAGTMTLAPAGTARQALPSPSSTSFRDSLRKRQFRLDSVWSTRPPSAPVTTNDRREGCSHYSGVDLCKQPLQLDVCAAINKYTEAHAWMLHLRLAQNSVHPQNFCTIKRVLAGLCNKAGW